MTRTFSEIFGLVKNKLLSVFVVMSLLIGANWAQEEIEKIAEYERGFSAVELKLKTIDEDLQKLLTGADPFKIAHAQAREAYEHKLLEIEEYKSKHPFARVVSPVAWWHLSGLKSELKLREFALATAESALTERTRELAAARKIAEDARLQYDEYLKWARRWKELLPVFWTAVGIVFVAIAASIAIKMLLYFAIAPMASRRPPIQILPNADGVIRSGSGHDAACDSGKVSSVSLPITLKEHEELLIQAEYLQSTSYRAEKRTQWFLNLAIPYSSILAGMFLLTRVRSPEADRVVVSATKDPLSEVSVIELSDGAAFVCQPRSLIGVIQDRSHPILITPHWRANNLQSWLTMQLRFLVFHGPGRLIVSGCRGVRLESAGTGRLINQAATLGFSANICYANTRCETFLAYLMGKEDLFNDIFTGESGFYLYEEMPNLKHKSGITGRGLEGIADAVLKLFGI